MPSSRSLSGELVDDEDGLDFENLGAANGDAARSIR
jgi:hypothetical protein